MICGQTRVPGVSVSQVARRYDVNANLVFAWLRDSRSADVGAPGVARFLPVEYSATIWMRRTRFRFREPLRHASDAIEDACGQLLISDALRPCAAPPNRARFSAFDCTTGATGGADRDRRI